MGRKVPKPVTKSQHPKTLQTFSWLLTVNDGRHENLIDSMQPSFDVHHSILHVFPGVLAITTAVRFHKLKSLFLYGFVFIGEEVGRGIRSRNEEVAREGKYNCDNSFDDVQPIIW